MERRRGGEIGSCVARKLGMRLGDATGYGLGVGVAAVSASAMMSRAKKGDRKG